MKDVSYSLASVYREPNVRRTYYILPVQQFENDTTFVKGSGTLDMIRQFGMDSRALYKKENKNINERSKE